MVFCDSKIESNDEMSGSFPSNIESNADDILFHPNIGSNDERYNSFPRHSESNFVGFEPN